MEHFSDEGHYAKLQRSFFLGEHLPAKAQFVPLLRTQRHVSRDRASVEEFETKLQTARSAMALYRCAFGVLGALLVVSGAVLSFKGWTHRFSASQTKIVAIDVIAQQRSWTTEEDIRDRQLHFEEECVGRVQLDRMKREEQGDAFKVHPEEHYLGRKRKKQAETTNFATHATKLARDEGMAQRILDRSEQRKRKHRWVEMNSIPYPYSRLTRSPCCVALCSLNQGSEV
jgi:hypothetical protein